MARLPSDSLQNRRTQLRTVSKIIPENDRDVFHDPSEESGYYNSSSPERSWQRDRSVSPATSHGSAGNSLAMTSATGKKGPPSTSALQSQETSSSSPSKASSNYSGLLGPLKQARKPAIKESVAHK